jgi:MFS transporter, DHA2 family, multidrug resistance protein
MSATATAAPPLTPELLARGIASSVPGRLSNSPLLGIVGVILGAGIVTLASRLLSLGLDDLKGHLGISYDDGAWISTSFNAALVFIGPFTVYLGGLLGPKRILMFAAGTFTLLSAFLPFVHNFSLLITALILAGLASGTFYPLTLTFALRNIPLRFLPYTMALYATCVDFAVNVAPTLYGWCRDDLSWHWMFWASAVITPVMMACVYWGIPAAPPHKASGSPPSFAGFLYVSAGLAIMYAAFDQGERLDWWRSGVFIALLLSGAFLSLCGLLRRLFGPNPLVALPYLRQWNTLALGILLFFFRFTLLSTIVLVPLSLSIHGFEANQIGPALIWTALPQLPIAFIVAFLLSRNVDPRLIMATGFGLIALACWMNASLTSAWSAENFYRTELLMGVGQSFAFLGLVSAIILQGLFSGGLAKPQWILTFSAFFHTVRLFGGNLGAVSMVHFISLREKFHSNLLGLHVESGNWITDGNVMGMAAGVYSRSSGVTAAAGRAVGILSARVRLQAYTLSIIDGFYLVAFACIVGMVLDAIMREAPLKYGHIIAYQATSASPQEIKP